MNMSTLDLNSWVSRVFPITGNNWKDRVRLTIFFRLMLDEIQREVKEDGYKVRAGLKVS